MKWVITFFILTHVSLASEYAGLIVKFKAKIAPEIKDKIHKKLDTKLSYRSTATRRDAINLQKKNNNHALLIQKCSDYKKESVVENCFPSERPTFPDCINCNIYPTSTNPISTLIEVVSATTCSPFPAMFEGDDLNSHQFGKQSPYWAQEAIGAPEAREFMLSQGPPRPVKMGFYDAGFSLESLNTLNLSPEAKKQLTTDLGPSDHGDPVIHLAGGDPPPGVSNVALISRLASANRTAGVSERDRVLDAFDIIRGFKSESHEDSPIDKSTMPEIVNMSMTVSMAYQEDIDSIASNTILVVSGGNEFPAPMNTTTKNGVPKIVACSLAPDGTVSRFSNTDDAVTICAPSDLNIQSSNGNEQVNFGGTSASAPMITGALSNAISYLPGLTTEEAEQLLIRSGIVTAGTPGKYPYTDGMGSLNSYRLVRVAAKLKDGWPSNRSQINNQTIYKFETEANDYFIQSQQLLKPRATCEQKKEGLKLLRKAFFLTPSENKYRTALASIYRTYGYESQARYFDDHRLTNQIPEVKQNLSERELIDLASQLKPGNTTGIFAQMKKLMEADTNLYGKYYPSWEINWTQLMSKNFKINEQAYNHQIIHFLMSNNQPIGQNWSIGEPKQGIVQWAVENENQELLDYLIKKNDSVDMTEALIRNVSLNDSQKIKMILDSDGIFDVNRVTDWSDHSIAGEAILRNDISLFRKFLKHNPAPDQLIFAEVDYENGEYIQFRTTEGIKLKDWIEKQDSRFNTLKRMIRKLH